MTSSSFSDLGSSTNVKIKQHVKLTAQFHVKRMHLALKLATLARRNSDTFSKFNRNLTIIHPSYLTNQTFIRLLRILHHKGSDDNRFKCRILRSYERYLTSCCCPSQTRSVLTLLFSFTRKVCSYLQFGTFDKTIWLQLLRNTARWCGSNQSTHIMWPMLIYSLMCFTQVSTGG